MIRAAAKATMNPIAYNILVSPQIVIVRADLYNYSQTKRLVKQNPVENKVLRNVDPPGIEPGPLPCHGSVMPIYYGPFLLLYLFFLKTQ